MRLPQDYKDLVATYGPGSFADYLHVYHPAGPTRWVDLTGPVPEAVRAQLRHDYDRGTHPVPYDPRFLFNMAGTDNGEDLFWITDPLDSPDSWGIAVNEARGPQWFLFDGTLTRFLADALGGRIDVPQFPANVLETASVFTPYPPGPEDLPVVEVRPPVDTDVIRRWARENGFEVPPRGRIPLVAREAWERAHPWPDPDGTAVRGPAGPPENPERAAPTRP
ncbi:Lsr2 family DNA-binding protein [Streptomyces sp. URMC 126]|uniref:Lsr2 family DNA-binding protein n=1 Tax=Streptomyces sp. URMC 126 TaxID=3423401 RepID=UPI003F1DC0AD